MTDTHVELAQGDLDKGTPIIFRPLKNGRIRLMYDPDQTTETSALAALRAHLPQLAGIRIVRLSRA